MKDKCIVLEGGGLRSSFTAGALEYLLEKKFNFDRVIGVSAGACSGASYISKQKGRNKTVNVIYPSDRRYMGFRHLITGGSYFNMKFIFGDIPQRLTPFDEATAFKNRSQFDVVVTSLDTGKSVVFTREDMKETGISNALVATSSIPLLSRPVDIHGKLYFDGGVADSIPVRYALSKHKKSVVILTREKGYRKGKQGMKGLIKVLFRKYPEFAKAILVRNDEYNRTLDFCEEMERKGRLFLLYPEKKFMIGRSEKDMAKRQLIYEHGYDLMKNSFSEMKKFLGS